MSEIIKAKGINDEISLPGLAAFKKLMSNEELSHAGKHTKSYHFLQTREKSATVLRYQRYYKVDFILNDGVIEINAIDGNTDVEDTYNLRFIEDMEEGARLSLTKED